jgi:hypothetical protein
MLSNNQFGWCEDEPLELHPPRSHVRVGGSSARTVHRAYRSLASLLLWLPLIVATGILGAGSMSNHGSDQWPAYQEIVSALPLRTDIQRYSARFTIAVKKSSADHRNLLEDYATFAAIWSEVSPEQPLLLKLVSPATVDPASKRVVPAIDNSPVAISEQDFAEFRPLLDDICTLIVSGDGTGRGKLPRSGYVAEPEELKWNHPDRR